MLWLALHFPWLPIESLPLRQPPSAVVAQGRVWLGDAAAGEAGVCPGQKLSTALGLVPGLAVFERDKQRERLALEGLAGWAGRFTPNLSLAPPDEILLDIGPAEPALKKVKTDLTATDSLLTSGNLALTKTPLSLVKTDLKALSMEYRDIATTANLPPDLTAALRALVITLENTSDQMEVS